MKRHAPLLESAASQAPACASSQADRLAPTVTPDEYCQDKAARSGSSFYYSFLFLPPEKRRAITAFYAFCREVDDVVDEIADVGIARAKLDWWRAEVARIGSPEAQHPVSLALAPFLVGPENPAAPVARERLLEVIEGMQMDLDQTRYLDFAELRRYCHYVAGVVGIVAARIFGASDPHTLDYAEQLGLAFQLTNIIRDVGEDARAGRVYLPHDEMQRYGVKVADLRAGTSSPAFVALMQFQADRARDLYASALASLPDADRRNQRPGLIMATIYRTLLEEVARDDFPVLKHRVALTPVRKLLLAWRTWVFGVPARIGQGASRH